ncbi:HPr family phosphocarrier protein [Mucilaginibacter sp.]|uniref:HPr family phosphocarrier protein n=1 Tax=Mucilaginibacter sp. TaxID=1882438 RepID=UPI0025FB9338|nr:HPr family phosphocarrier protein [Mucilaginibacter sp.]
MVTTNLIILAPQGLHARPVTALIRLAKGFKSNISLQKGDKTVKLNSMLNILSLTIKGGETITIIIDGEDETEASAAINHFFTEELKHL